VGSSTVTQVNGTFISQAPFFNTVTDELIEAPVEKGTQLSSS